MTAVEPAVSRFARIMATTDGSRVAAVGVERAIELAAAHGAALELVHAANEDLSRLEPRVHAREIDEACRPLEATAAEHGVTLTRHVVPGRASRVLVEQARTLAPDLVVMGARGRTVFDRLLLGSVTDRVIRQIEVPVMVVHEGDTRSLADVRTIVAGVDFSDHTPAVMLVARRLLAARGGPGTIELVHAETMGADPMVAAGGAEFRHAADARAADARRRLDALVESTRESGLAVQSVFDTVGAVELLDREVRQLSADLLVVGRSGAGRLERMLLGSVAQRSMEHACCPVVVVGS